MAVVTPVKFPKTFSPRVLIRNSIRVNDIDIQSKLDSTLTLSVHCWQAPLEHHGLETFPQKKNFGYGFCNSLPDSSYGPITSANKTLDHHGYMPHNGIYSCCVPESGEENDRLTSLSPRWNLISDSPQDLSLKRHHGHDSPAKWEERSDGLPSPSELSSGSSNHHRPSGRHRGKVKVFKCPYCVISCSNRGQLLGHIRIHTGERPFVCQEPGCKKAFIRNEELTRHRRIHTGERPYQCHTCKKAFTRKDHLNKHVKIHTAADDIFSG